MLDMPYRVEVSARAAANLHSGVTTTCWEIHLTGDGKVATVYDVTLAYHMVDLLNSYAATEKMVRAFAKVSPARP